jgi:O-antigen/teichoic acid export membrane protein
MVSGLGRGLFGVWEMLGRWGGYMDSTEGRASQALRLVISNQRSVDDPAAKRRWVGSALVVWLMFLPVWIAVGAVLVWLSPMITKVTPALYSTVRLACALMAAGVLLGGLASLPESVLRGMNLGYKRMGLQAGVSLVGGALLAGTVFAGFGLVGVAASGVVVAALTGLCFWVVVRRQVPWFGVERPGPAEVGTLLQMSLWIVGGDLVSKVLLASDVLVLGLVLSPSAVTTYVLTGYGARLAANLHTLASDSAMPGIAGVIGEKDFERAALLRREMLAITMLFGAAAGSTILLWNRSFVHLWVGSENYAGPWTDILLVVIAVQTASIRCDSYLIDAALQPGRRVRVSAVAGLAVVVLSLILTYWAGMVGLCPGIIAGRAIQSIWYPVLVQGCIGRAPARSTWLARSLFFMGLLFAGSAYAGQHILAGHWATWTLAVLLSVPLVICIALISILPPDLQAAVLARTREMTSRLGMTRSGRR